MSTNFELIDLGKILNIPNLKVVCKDELKNIIDYSLPINIIVNLNNSDNNINGHWNLIFIDKNQKIYYSSYGDPIPLDCQEFMMKIDKRPDITSNNQIQSFNSTDCGLYCILILRLLNKNIDFIDIINSFYLTK